MVLDRIAQQPHKRRRLMPHRGFPWTILLAASIIAVVSGFATFDSTIRASRRNDLTRLEREWHDTQLKVADGGLVRVDQETVRILRFREALNQFLGSAWFVGLQRALPKLEAQSTLLRSAVSELVVQPGDTWPDFRVKAMKVDQYLDDIVNEVAAYFGARRRVSEILIFSLVGLVAVANAVIIGREVSARGSSRRGAKEHAHALLEAQANERLRISHDLHDKVAQDLSAARLASETLLDGFVSAPGDLRHRAALLSEAIASSLRTLREIAFDMRPPDRGQTSLAASLNELCESFGRANAQATAFRSAGMDGINLPSVVENNLLGIAQEALANVARHAQAHTVAVSLVVSGTDLVLKINDDGLGFDYERTCSEAAVRKCMGLIGMQERAALLGAHLDVLSAPGVGTQVKVTVRLDGTEIQGGAAEESTSHRRS